MNRNQWIFIGILVLAAVIATVTLLLPTAEDILVQAIETAQSIDDGHVVVAMNLDSLEQDGYGIIEIWARGGEGGHGAFRVEVLEASQENAVGATIVSDGETLWAYSAVENKVFIGTAEDAHAMLQDGEYFDEYLSERFGDFQMPDINLYDIGDYQTPESVEEAVAMLKEYVTFKKSGREVMAGESAQMITLEPISEKMPREYGAVGGLVNVWIGRQSDLPLGLAFTGSSLGEFNFTVLELEVNSGIDDSLFTFEIPTDAEMITFADLKPQTLTLEEAGAALEFELLTPSETPEGATLVDIVEMRGALVKRYTLPEGGSFTIAQGLSGDIAERFGDSSSESQAIDVRGTTGQLFASEAGDKVLLTWIEGDLFFSVAGDLTAESALAIAESLE